MKILKKSQIQNLQNKTIELQNELYAILKSDKSNDLHEIKEMHSHIWRAEKTLQDYVEFIDTALNSPILDLQYNKSSKYTDEYVEI